MIGIKGVAKKPITDATAVSSDIISGKVAYNNTGRVVGSITNSSVLKEFNIHIEKGTYTNTKSNISYTYPKGSVCLINMDNGFGDLSIEVTTQESSSTVTGIIKTGGNAVYLSEGLFPEDLYSKYVVCGIQYIGSTRAGVASSERLFFANSSHQHQESVTTRKYRLLLDRYAKTNYDATDTSTWNQCTDTKYSNITVFIFNNYWAVGVYNDGNQGYVYSATQVDIPDSFDIKLLLTNKIS